MRLLAFLIILQIPPRNTEVVPDQNCVVSRRLPSFALTVGRQNVSPNKATLSASRMSGGACRMGRLPRIQHTNARTWPTDLDADVHKKQHDALLRHACAESNTPCPQHAVYASFCNAGTRRYHSDFAAGTCTKKALFFL